MPVVDFFGDRISFPDDMGADSISDVLGALAASAKAVVEFAGTVGSASIAEPIAGLTGLATGDIDKIGKIQDMLTYQPRTQAGRIAMQSIAKQVTTLSEAAGLNHLSGYWRDRVVPALQQQAGPIAGSVLAAVGLAAITALGEITPVGKTKRIASSVRQRGAIGDTDVFFHGGPEVISEIREEGLFDGIFASRDRGVAESHGGVVTILGGDDIKIARTRDLDNEISLAEIKRQFPTASEQELDVISDVIIFEDNLFDLNIPEKRINELFGGDSLGASDFEAQRLRGVLAKKQGFSAVEMTDEHGGGTLLLLSTGKIKPLQ